VDPFAERTEADVESKRDEARRRGFPYESATPTAGIALEATVLNGDVKGIFKNGYAAGDIAEGMSQTYISKAVYSLPVRLPRGEVRLDFARPSGGAQLSIWAVPVRKLHTLYGSVAVAGLSALLILIIKIWPRPEVRKPVTARWMIGYLILTAALVVFLGLLGLFLCFVLILVMETFRNRTTIQSKPKKSVSLA
jgi:hypothetical protein